MPRSNGFGGPTASFSSTAAPPLMGSAAGAPGRPGERAAADVRGKLWSITTEYENLLQIQNEHFEACIRAKDKTIEQLKSGKAVNDPVAYILI